MTSCCQEISLIFLMSTCAGEEWELTNSEMASIASAVFAGILGGNLVWGIISTNKSLNF
jgi:hypothetical protein